MKKKDLTYFAFRSNQVKPARGNVIIADPFGDDLYFKRSVVLITEHNRQHGTVGMVLNKPVVIKDNDFFQDFPTSQVAVSLGGPVNTNAIHFLHTYGTAIQHSEEILPGLYWGGDFDVIKEIVRIDGYDQTKLRFFVGYSGWDSGQLEDELERNAWLVSSLPTEKIMSYYGAETWKLVMRNMGNKFSMWANTPENPSLN